MKKYSDSAIYKIMTDAGINLSWAVLTDRNIRHKFVTDNGKRIILSITHDGKNKANRDWRFNFQNRPESSFDFAVCCLSSDIGGGQYTRLFVFPAEIIAGRIITLTPHTLNTGRYDFFVENWDLIKGS